MRLNIVAAVDMANGIGKGGTLPWDLKCDMRFFERVTKTAATGKQNAVVMGRKTWDSIPVKYRPMKNRINIVISTTFSSLDGATIVRSFEEALSVLNTEMFPQLDQIFIIGGTSVYDSALKYEKRPIRLYLTRIFDNFGCDTFFPNVDYSKLKPIQCKEMEYMEENHQELKCELHVYERKG